MEDDLKNKMKKSDLMVLRASRDRESMTNQFCGAFCVMIFILTWISSLLSPILLHLSFVWGYYVLSLFIVTISICSYVPWEKGFLANRFSYFLHTYHPAYYKSVTMVFEDGDIPARLGDDNNKDERLSAPKAKEQQTFYAVHPHGAFCIGWSFLFVHPLLRSVRFCFAPLLYASPFFRLFSRSCGNPGSASRPAMDSYLKRGMSVALPPGGFEEATLTSTDVDRVFCKKRTGFIRLCLQYGVKIKPVFVFGECGLFSNVQGCWDLRLKMNRYGLPALLAYGRWFCPIMPKKNVDLYVVVGKALVLPKIENPTKEEITLWHDKYTVELRRLYEDYKEFAYGSDAAKTAKLEVW